MILITGNLHKRDEFRRLMPEVNWETLGEWERHRGLSSFETIEETGQSFAENAIIKAKEGWKRTQSLCLADDSGLCVDALNGAPGIFSARYVEGSDEDRYKAVLRALEGFSPHERGAAFHCVLAICGLSSSQEDEIKRTLPSPRLEWRDGCLLAFGQCEGSIREHPYGEGGFGYDPIFNLKDGRSFASITGEEKDKFSHRGLALQALRPLSKIFS